MHIPANPLFKITTHTLLQSVYNPLFKENRTTKTPWEIRLRLLGGTQFFLFTIDQTYNNQSVQLGHYRYYLLPVNYVKCDDLFDIGYGGIHHSNAFSQKTTFQPSVCRRSNKWESDMGDFQSNLYFNLSMPIRNIIPDNPKYKELFDLYMDSDS
ncbi:MAG: hypothetical protein RL662_2367 [Bacteroidota bacterium]|jgi:hypothetical protein